MMEHRPTHLFYHAVHHEPPPTGDARCFLCAAPCPDDGPRVDEVLRTTFNDMARTRQGGDSDVTCAACAFYFDFKIMRPGAKRAMGLFTKSTVITPTGWREWLREDMADDLLRWHEHGLEEDTLLALNYSKQKHVLPWARVNPANSRRPWIETDQGRLTLPDALPAMVAAVAELWGRGHNKGAIAAGQPTPFVLARSPCPARDLALLALLEPHVQTPTIDLATYVVTEDNRDRLAADTRCAAAVDAVLGDVQPRPAAGDSATGDPERGGRPVVQEPVRAPVVGHAGRAGQAVRDDEPRPGPAEQFALI